MEKFNEYYNKFLKEKLLTKEAPTGYSTGIQGKPKQEVVPMKNKIEKTDALKNKDEVADKEEVTDEIKTLKSSKEPTMDELLNIMTEARLPNV